MITPDPSVTPELLAKMFQDNYAALSDSFIHSPWDRPLPWDAITPERQKLLVKTFETLYGVIRGSGDAGILAVSSLVSGKTRKGVVGVHWGAMAGQMTVEEARQMAQQFMACAEAAETDEIALKIFSDGTKDGEMTALRFINQLRLERAQKGVPKAESEAGPPA